MRTTARWWCWTTPRARCSRGSVRAAASRRRQVDGVTALRQAGSTLKPFLYALAFERRDLTAASLLDDSPLALTTGNGLYVPQNYVPQYRGWVSARMALGGSLNVPAVRTLVRIGPDASCVTACWLRLRQPDRARRLLRFQPGARLGRRFPADAGQRLPDAGQRRCLVAAARHPGGTGSPAAEAAAACFPAGPPRRCGRRAVFIVSDILADRTARVGTFGLESWLATPYWSAAKTGTSKDMRDNWCAGYSSRYTVAVWVGNAAGEAMHDVSGISGAAPVWREIMDWLQRGAAQGTGVASKRGAGRRRGVAQRQIRFEPPGPRQRNAAPGVVHRRQRSHVVRSPSSARWRTSPTPDGTIIALDADIPPARQRLLLQLSASGEPGWQWHIDQQPAGRADRPSHWLPQPGKHRLALLDAGNRELDAVEFEVRALRKAR